MALLNNPVSVEILRESGRLEVLDVFPVYEEMAHAFVATDVLSIYEGFPKDNDQDPASDIKRDPYLQYIELCGADNPLFLGELHIGGSGLPDWQYHGSKLSENEIWQIVAVLIQLTYDGSEEEAVIDAILNEADNTPEGLAFVYSNGLHTDTVRIEEAEGHFMVLINEELTTQIEMPDEVWEVTEGDIPDRTLLAEIISRIDAAAH